MKLMGLVKWMVGGNPPFMWRFLGKIKIDYPTN
jgi:hypothetical protein